jgi:CBS domain-containing protein
VELFETLEETKQRVIGKFPVVDSSGKLKGLINLLYTIGR